MTIYVVGDIQGCQSCLEQLLIKVNFGDHDQLWSVGDLVNRGPESLATLRFCKALGHRFRTVLGNHDLSLLAIAHGAKPPNKKDTIQEILEAPDKDELLQWLQSQPILIRHKQYVLVHAGIPPQWSLQDACRYAAELEDVLADKEKSALFFTNMFGNTPACWHENLDGFDRLRAITNYFTRMRYCDAHGYLDFENKMPPVKGSTKFLPWFEHSNRKTRDNKLIFGHWASLEGNAAGANLFALDTGCVWGGRLRAMSLDDEQYYHQPCKT